MLELSLDEKRTDSSDFFIKQVHMILDPETKEGTYDSALTTYSTSGNSSTITQPGIVYLLKCGTLK